MDEFDYDSAKNNVKQRIKYLDDEKLKVKKVKKRFWAVYKKQILC